MKTIIYSILFASLFILTGFTKENAVNILKKNNTEVNESSMQKAMGSLDFDTIELLIDAGFNMNYKGNGKLAIINMLIIASQQADSKIEQEKARKLAFKLVDKGVNLNPTVPDEISPLAIASMTNNYELAEKIIGKGANINYAFAGNNNALTAAVSVSDLKMIKLLLSKGATKNNLSDQTFSELVRKTNNTELIEFLLPHDKLIEAGKTVGKAAIIITFVGFLSDGFEGIKDAWAFVIGVILLIIFGIIGAIMIMAQFFGNTMEKAVQSKYTNPFGFFERIARLIPSVRKVMEEEERFQRKITSKYTNTKTDTEEKGIYAY